jgi:hypothetical protein
VYQHCQEGTLGDYGLRMGQDPLDMG